MECREPLLRMFTLILLVRRKTDCILKSRSRSRDDHLQNSREGMEGARMATSALPHNWEILGI